MKITTTMTLMVFIMGSPSSYAAHIQRKHAADNACKAVYRKIENEDLRYFLFTQQDILKPNFIRDNNVDELKKKSIYNPKNENVFIVHGWAGSHSSLINQLLVPAILRKYDVNIIVADWSRRSSDYFGDFDFIGKDKCCIINYYPQLGSLMANFIEEMVRKYALNLKTFHLIGTGIGAHIVGVTGSILQKKLGKKVDTIVGLNPTSVGMFHQSGLSERNAEYVMVMHTARTSESGRLGHADYYVNGGQRQPGCDDCIINVFIGICDANRALEYYAESIESQEYVAYWCPPFVSSLSFWVCKFYETPMGGLHIHDRKAGGVYYLKTKATYPYAFGKNARGNSGSISVSLVNIVAKEVTNFLMDKANFLLQVTGTVF